MLSSVCSTIFEETYIFILTAHLNQRVKCLSTPLSTVAENSELTTFTRSSVIPREAPKRPPPVPRFTKEQSVKCQTDQSRKGAVPGHGGGPNRASGVLQTTNESTMPSNAMVKVVHKEYVRIQPFCPPPSRPPPRPPPDKVYNTFISTVYICIYIILMYDHVDLDLSLIYHYLFRHFSFIYSSNHSVIPLSFRPCFGHFPFI